MNITYEFGPRLIFYEQRLWNPYGLEDCDNGVAVYGDNAVAQFGRFRGRQWGYRVFDDKGKEIHSEQQDNSSIDTPHARNFLDSMRSRQKPRVDIEEGHWATTLAHLGNIVSRTGRTIHFDPKTESIPDDSAANLMIRREYRPHWSTPKSA
jgi:hypothetical protein